MGKKKEKVIKEDKSNWKLEVYDIDGRKRVWTLDWEGHMIDKSEEI